jgi:hypothetical protein
MEFSTGYIEFTAIEAVDLDAPRGRHNSARGEFILRRHYFLYSWLTLAIMATESAGFSARELRWSKTC